MLADRRGRLLALLLSLAAPLAFAAPAVVLADGWSDPVTVANDAGSATAVAGASGTTAVWLAQLDPSSNELTMQAASRPSRGPVVGRQHGG